jgi:very-short-patch-repair endonuclease
MYSYDFYNKDLRTASRALRKNMTKAEKKLWYDFLCHIKPKVHRQRPMGKFITDFYIPKAKLIIKVDGPIHENEKVSAKDADRTLFFASLGVLVLRITNNEIFHDFDRVCKRISTTIQNRLLNH